MADYWGKPNQNKKKSQRTMTVKEKLLRTCALAIFLSLLVAFDFILYLHSGSVFLAEGGINIPVLINVLYIFAVCTLLMFGSFIFVPLQAVIFSGVCALLTIGFMTQFLQVDRAQYLEAILSSTFPASFLYAFDGISHWIVAGIVFVLAYWFIIQISNKSIMYFSGFILFVIMCLYGADFISGKAPEQIAELYSSTENHFAPQKKKMVFLFLPHAAPYSVISAESRNKMDKRELLQHVELGFLVKNGFKVYSNAYATADSDETNMVEILNILDNKNYRDHVLKKVGMDSLWKFKSAQRPNLFLRDNQLQDIFQKAQYKVSTIQTPQIELCKKNGQYVVDKCLSRISLPVDITDRGFSDDDRTTVLLYQWINSFELINNKRIVDVLGSILSKSGMKNLSYPYDKLYTVNSFQVLQKLLDEISENTESGVYFVYLNFPDDMLIYNEWCKIKPFTRWNTLNPRFQSSMIYNNSMDYNEQMLCLWGQMSDFMQNLVSSGAADNLTLILHGVSGVERLSDSSKSFVDKFKSQNLVFMAIRDPGAKFSVNRRVCHGRDLLRQHLFGQLCQEYSGMQFSKSSRETLLVELKDSGIKSFMTEPALKEYEKWLENWQMNRQPPFLKASFSAKQKPLETDTKLIPTDTAAQILSEGLENFETSDRNPSAETDVQISIQEAEINTTSDISAEESIVPLTHSSDQENPLASDELSSKKDETEPKVISEKKIEVIEDIVEQKPATVEKKVPEKKIQNPEPAKPQKLEKISSKEINKPIPNTNNSISISKSEATPPQTPKTKIVIKPQGNAKITIHQPTYEYADVEEAAPALNQALKQTESTISETDSLNNGTVLHAEQHAVSGDFLLQENQDNWEFDPAKALGVSGDEPQNTMIVIKEQ